MSEDRPDKRRPDIPPDAGWRRASRCTGNGCAEVLTEVGHAVSVRSSKKPEQVVDYDLVEWRDLVVAIKAGEFDV